MKEIEIENQRLIKQIETLQQMLQVAEHNTKTFKDITKYLIGRVNENS